MDEHILGCIDRFAASEVALRRLERARHLMEDGDGNGGVKELVGGYSEIIELPTADVVPVVRCKDCKHINHLPWMDDETGRAVICSKHSFTGLRSDEWFCADGERRE